MREDLKTKHTYVYVLRIISVFMDYLKPNLWDCDEFLRVMVYDSFDKAKQAFYRLAAEAKEEMADEITDADIELVEIQHEGTDDTLYYEVYPDDYYSDIHAVITLEKTIVQ